MPTASDPIASVSFRMPRAPVIVHEIAINGSTLSAEEFGAYCFLVFLVWRGYELWDNDKFLARLCHLSTFRWRRTIRPVLEPFFDIKDGRWLPNLSRDRKSIPKYVRDKIWDACGGRCSYCGVQMVRGGENNNPAQFTIDHKIAWIFGGSDESENLTGACRSCNIRKGAGHCP